MRFMMKLFVPVKTTNKPFIDTNYSEVYEFEFFFQELILQFSDPQRQLNLGNETIHPF